MADGFLGRDGAPFGERVWRVIDETVTGTAKAALCGRRLLHIEGPHGLGLKHLPGPDKAVDGSIDGVAVRAGAAVPVPAISSSFNLSARDIASFEATGIPFDTSGIARAASRCAAQEDALVFCGSAQLGVPGLLTAEGVKSSPISEWELGVAVKEVIAAIGVLDEAGFHGPYALALEPARYNLLFRIYTQGNTTEFEHLAQLVTGGVIKAHAIKEGGVLIAVGRHFASIALGQDLVTSFVGPTGDGFEFCVSESAVLRLAEPAAVCALRA